MDNHLLYHYGNFHDSRIQNIEIDLKQNTVLILLDDVNRSLETGSPPIVEAGILKFFKVRKMKFESNEDNYEIFDILMEEKGDSHRIVFYLTTYLNTLEIVFSDLELIPVGKDKFKYSPING